MTTGRDTECVPAADSTTRGGHGPPPGQAPRMTVPNVLSGLRLAGAPLVVVLAFKGNEPWLVALLVTLLMTDWIDGKLAVWLHQATRFGAVLDTIADVALYTAIGVSLLMQRPEQLEATWPWIVAAAVSYLMSAAVSLFKFRRVASYHTLGAKAGWGLASAGTLAVFAFSWSWPFVVVGVWTTAVNLEAIAISIKLDRWRPDVRGIWKTDEPTPHEHGDHYS